MSTVGPTDVQILAISTEDDAFVTGTDITFEVTAKVGSALFSGGGRYQVRLSLTDTTNPALLDDQQIEGKYTDTDWPAAGLNTFTFTVPGAATTGRDGNLLEPQASLVGGAVAPFDTSQVVGDRILLIAP